MTSEQPDYEKRRKTAEAETAALKAELERLQAHKALEAAKAPIDPDKKSLEERLAAAKAAKELAEAEKAAADARKAEADAAVAALKAQIGEVPASGYTGEVALKDKAGLAEAVLLAAKAVNTAAGRIAARVVEKVPDTGTILLYPATDAPRLNALLSFRSQTALVEKAFTEAEKISSAAHIKAPRPAFRPPAGRMAAAAFPVAGAGLALDALNKFLGFLRSDYTAGGIELTQQDSLLVHAVAGVIRTVSKDKLQVRLPGTYSPQALSDAGLGLLEDLRALSLRRVAAQEAAADHDRLSIDLRSQAEQEKDGDRKRDLEEKAQSHKTAGDALRVAVGLYDAFLGRLTAADDKGAVPLTEVIRDAVVYAAVADGALLLLVKLHSGAGSYYTKKNMWTLFGGMPFYNMAGVVVSHVLLNGTDGSVKAADVFPVHGGFFRIGEIKDHVTRGALNLPERPGILHRVFG